MTTSSLDTIERVLSLCPRVHIYNIPPLTSNKGHNAASWTADPARQIFTARLRVLESATPNLAPDAAADSTLTTTTNSSESHSENAETITVKILLEDPATGALFAEAPYTHPSVVEPAQDSSRFFAVRVVSSSPPDDNGKGSRQLTATLGIGFEDRSDAVDFGICLQEARKVLRFDGDEDRDRAGGGGKVGPGGLRGKKEAGTEGTGAGAGKRDWSLKEGETIKIDVGNRTGRRVMPTPTQGQQSQRLQNPGADGHNNNKNDGSTDTKAPLFSIKPPPPPPPPSSSSTSTSTTSAPAGSKGSIPLLAPPPPPSSSSASSEARAERRRSREVPAVVPVVAAAAAAAGFDDGEFGEFQ